MGSPTSAAVHARWLRSIMSTSSVIDFIKRIARVVLKRLALLAAFGLLIGAYQNFSSSKRDSTPTSPARDETSYSADESDSPLVIFSDLRALLDFDDNVEFRSPTSGDIVHSEGYPEFARKYLMNDHTPRGAPAYDPYDPEALRRSVLRTWQQSFLESGLTQEEISMATHLLAGVEAEKQDLMDAVYSEDMSIQEYVALRPTFESIAERLTLQLPPESVAALMQRYQINEPKNKAAREKLYDEVVKPLTDYPEFYAVSSGDEVTLRAYLEAGLDVNATRIERPNETLLGKALHNESESIVRLLLDYGADPNEVSEIGISSLMSATMDGKLEMVEALLDAGADPTYVSNNGLTASIIARQRSVREFDSEPYEQLYRVLREAELSYTSSE